MGKATDVVADMSRCNWSDHMLVQTGNVCVSCVCRIYSLVSRSPHATPLQACMCLCSVWLAAWGPFAQPPCLVIWVLALLLLNVSIEGRQPWAGQAVAWPTP